MIDQEDDNQFLRFKIPSSDGPIDVPVVNEKPMFVLGRNGVGKSALVHWMYSKLPEPVRYIPGSRQNQFEHDHLSMTPAQLTDTVQTTVNRDRNPTARYRPWAGAKRNERSAYQIQTEETQYKLDALEEIKRDGEISPAIQRLRQNSSPLDRLNALMEQGNLEVCFTIAGGEMKAKRGEAVFSLAKMSDGERSALFMASEVLIAKANTVFIMDEPELHLHPAIIVPFMRGLMAERPDCSFIVSTHELDIAVHSDNAMVVFVRGCEWHGDSVSSWDIDILDDSGAVPEDLRTDLYGARRKLLFVEGISTSLDQPLYALLFPDVSVRDRETCTEVIRAVLGLQGCEELHHASAFGMVDGDGMDAAQADEFEAKKIFVVPFYSVESLYYCRELIEAVAHRQGETLNVAGHELIKTAYAAALGVLNEGNKQHLACKMSERVLRDAVLNKLPKGGEIMNSKDQDLTITISSPFNKEVELIEECIARSDLDALISRYPVRESPVLNEVAKALRFARREDYEKAVLSRLSAEPALREAIADKLGGLKDQLRG